MKKKLTGIVMVLVLLCCGVGFTACGSSEDTATEEATQEEVTEETVQAADPMTDEEMENDDSEGCIDDSEDLLY